MTTHCFADEYRWPLLWNPVNRYSRQQLAKLSFFFSCQINTKAIVSKPDSTLSHEPYSIHFGSGQCRVGCCVLVRHGRHIAGGASNVISIAAILGKVACAHKLEACGHHVDGYAGKKSICLAYAVND
ncbi:predicted protein [Lichtheimia corymbifera JMRC:FSU:9682]|uniref:Uncharacterized protein n=1 Tax=Lichtheimia corymbifera JMRC:FSU:9682 TaxID=1263082 RepID=A0A068RKS8_9FUNG|nr:predicted protein [Lichtheimia corymbifera JMRC:FSU:9682]